MRQWKKDKRSWTREAGEKKDRGTYSESGAAGKRKKKRRGKKAEVTAEGSKHTWLNTCPRGKSIQRARGKFVPTISVDSRVRLVPVHLRHRDDSEHAIAQSETHSAPQGSREFFSALQA